MLVLVDCDGVLANFVKAFLDAYNGIAGTHHTSDEITSYDITNALPGLTHDGFHSICSSPGFCRSFVPIDGAIDEIDKLRRQGHTLLCVTAPMEGIHWVHERVEWLRDEAGFEFSEIVFTSRKQLIDGDILIDDNTSYLREWCKGSSKRIPILFSTPYNVDDDVSSFGGIRCATWVEIVDTIDRVQKNREHDERE